jgi:formylglycine-generating enzyme required for sulfatase activity
MPTKAQELAEQAFPYDNHPRETVSWYQAVAFCRWLSDKLGYLIELPHEYEWEAAARYPDGRFYPWGNQFDKNLANTSESGVGQTTAVGIYPANELGLCDMSGNVWEWCRNKYDNPEDETIDDSGGGRVLRGGSWLNDQEHARAAYPDSTIQTTVLTMSVSGWWCVVPHLILISDLCSCLRSGSGAGFRAKRDRGKFKQSLSQ